MSAQLQSNVHVGHLLGDTIILIRLSKQESVQVRRDVPGEQLGLGFRDWDPQNGTPKSEVSKNGSPPI